MGSCPTGGRVERNAQQEGLYQILQTLKGDIVILSKRTRKPVER